MLRPLIRFSNWLLFAALLVVLSSRVNAEFTPIAGWDRQLFPSHLIATATIRTADVQADQEAEDDSDEGDERSDDEAEEQDANDGEDDGAQLLGDRQGVLGVMITTPGDDVPVTVTISGDAVVETSTFSGTLASEGTTYAVFPKIKYKYDVLIGNKQPVPVSVTFEVEVGEEDVEEQTVTMTLRSLNDCPFTIAHADGSVTDVSFIFAAYVNEQHPFVDKLLREALDGGAVDSFTGYQSGEAAEVYRQVYALWHALSQRDVRYSNITTSAAENHVVSSQHVRLIDESINNAQANCVDGSVLFASLLRKIDIEPVLVFVPGHCYLAFFPDAEGKELVALETTLIGSSIEDGPTEIAGLKDVVDDNWRKQSSWATFCAAIAMGTDDFAKNQGKFNDPADTDYQTISIAAARKLGILPIAFDSDEEFESVTSEDE